MTESVPRTIKLVMSHLKPYFSTITFIQCLLHEEKEEGNTVDINCCKCIYPYYFSAGLMSIR